MNRLFKYISTIFLIIIILQMLPSTLNKLKSEYRFLREKRVDLAKIKIDKEIIDIDEHTKNLKSFFENKDIKGILLQLESPGGAAGSSQALFKEIKSLKQENPKPVVVITNNICASGAYYIACSADYIVSSPAALIGSIGAYVAFFKLKALIESYKIQYDVKKSGEFKTVGNMFTDMTPEMDQMMQEMSDNIYKQFTKDIAIARKLSLKDIDKWANGRIFTGEQALALKLVDETGSEFNAIKKLKELALIEKNQKINWVKPKGANFVEKILSGNFAQAAAEKLISANSRIIAMN